MNTDNCPYCGAEIIVHPLDNNHTILDCGSVEGWRTPLCREREEHNKTREDLEQLNIAGVTAVEAAKLFKLRAEKAEAENQKLRDLLDELINGSTRMTKEIVDEYEALTK